MIIVMIVVAKAMIIVDENYYYRASLSIRDTVWDTVLGMHDSNNFHQRLSLP